MRLLLTDSLLLENLLLQDWFLKADVNRSKGLDEESSATKISMAVQASADREYLAICLPATSL